VATDWGVGSVQFTAEIAGETRTLSIEKASNGFTIATRGAAHRVRALAPRGAELARQMIAKVAPGMSK
jgi:propionyl-CoA carboxylase alpha chain